MSKPSNERILLVDELSKPTRFNNTYSDTTCFRATVACVNPATDTPINWSYAWDSPVRGDTGGCSVSCFASTDLDDNHIIHTLTKGHQVHSSDEDEYQRALKALRLINKRLAKINDERGYPRMYGAEHACRWIEATGVKRVFRRPDIDTGHGWLSEGSWISTPTGEFLTYLRGVLDIPQKTDTSKIA